LSLSHPEMSPILIEPKGLSEVFNLNINSFLLFGIVNTSIFPGELELKTYFIISSIFNL